jgi:hypothetical protein
MGALSVAERGLENGQDVRSSNRTLPVAGIEDYGLERLLAQPVRREPGITEHWSLPLPRFRQVEFHWRTDEELD